MTTCTRLAGGLLILVVVAAGAAILAQAPQDPQRPIFRTGTSLVRVDAYPSKDGKIIEGLAAEDFEVFEDGVPQKIETFQFIRYEGYTPSSARRDPNSQRDAFNLAADPSYRIFVIYLDNLHVHVTGSHAVRQPLINFMNRVLGVNDLFGVLTTAQSVDDLMLGQRTEFIEEQLTKYWDWGRGARVSEDDEDLMVETCFGARNNAVTAELIRRRRLNEVFSDLEGIMAKLAEIREERKNVLLVSDGWAITGRADWVRSMVKPTMPGIGVTDAGKITMGRTRPGEIDPRACEDFLQLADIDFRDRFRRFLQLARTSNVTFYSIKPSGLVACSGPGCMDQENERVDALRSLADQTDGIAVVNTNDLRAGAERIGDDLSASYILGYYPTNTKADGRIRRITVKLKGSNETVRARREYRAPTEEEMASMRAATAPAAAALGPSGADVALTELKRLRPGAVLHSLGTIIGDELVLTTEITAPEVEAGRWKSGGEVQVMVSGSAGDVLTMIKGWIEPGARAAVIRIPIGNAPGPFNAAIRLRGSDGEAQDDVGVARTSGMLGRPLLYRLQTPTTARPAASVLFRRTERIQVRWPVTGPVESKQVRILGRDGVPLGLQVTVKELEDGGVNYVVADLNLAPLTQGEYVLEAIATGQGRTESSLLAIRVTR